MTPSSATPAQKDKVYVDQDDEDLTGAVISNPMYGLESDEEAQPGEEELRSDSDEDKIPNTFAVLLQQSKEKLVESPKPKEKELVYEPDPQGESTSASAEATASRPSTFLEPTPSNGLKCELALSNHIHFIEFLIFSLSLYSRSC